MKKYLLSCAGVALAMSAAAAEYPALAFELADGTVRSVSAANLSMTFAGGNLVADHAAGRLEIPVADLRKFYFTGGQASVADVALDADEAVEVYSATGMRMGRYSSEADAKADLPAGLYVMKSASRIFKTVVR